MNPSLMPSISIGAHRPIISTVRLITQAFVVGIKLPFHFLDHLTAHRKSQVIYFSPLDSISPSQPILIYVHYSKSGVLTEREVDTLRNIRKTGFQICVVVNTEKSHLLEKIATHKENYNENYTEIIRKNVGWDLSAYRDVFFLLKKNGKVKNQPIIFMNNSVIWFPEMAESYFNGLVKQESDLIGASVSNQYRPHIQTFLFGSLNDVGTIEIEKWLKSIRNWRSKRTVVSYGELATIQIIKSSAKFMSFPDQDKIQELGLKKIHEDFESSDLADPPVVIKRLQRNRAFTHAGIPVNPSHDYWLEMLESGFPGIKVDLVRSNPSQLYDYEIAIKMLLESGFNYQMLNRLLISNKSKSVVFKIRTLLKW
jgi:hypothetical protein